MNAEEAGQRDSEAPFPEALLDLLGRNSRGPLPHSDEFYQAVDDSDYSLIDWTEALLEFDRWLESRKIMERPFQSMVSYVHCCTRLNPAGVRLPDLKTIVCQALGEFGFDLGNGAQI